MDKESTGSLSTAEAQKKFREFGPNLIFKSSKISFFAIARHEVTEPMIILLLIVGIVYSIWGKIEDAVTIFIVIFLLIMAEVYNEFRAKKAIASLEKIAMPKTKVLRDENITEIDPENVVPGDILILTAGTKIAADAKVQKSLNLQVEESMLTGESFPVEKNENDEIFAGTFVVSGEGQAMVQITGKNTKLGIIAAQLKEVKPPKTALQMAMKSLALKLVYLAVFFSVLIPVLGILRGQDLKTMILTGLSLSFATIPEELPIIITMVLGLGAYTLSKNNFLVKKIKAAETLGNATVIVSDKTGTITESQMKIVSMYPDNEEEIIKNAVNTISKYSESPMENEIKKRAGKLKITNMVQEAVRQRNPGNGQKSKSVVIKTGDEYELFTSGAPEEIFTMCMGKDITEDVKNELAKETSKGRRVISVAYRKLNLKQTYLDFKELEKEMKFVGLISFEDPPASGVKNTVAVAAKAGIRTIMVTGDHPATAHYIANEVGISSLNGEVLTGSDLDNLTDEELQQKVKLVSVFARANPHHKYRIVKALQKNGEVIAVTGDGINDAIALKGADIGIAMGIKGTDVAKDSAEVVLADDNFNTIARGIFEGRKFFDNLQKGIKYYLSVKFALILIFLLPVALGVPLPLAPIQIIILELFMDLAASAGFVAEPAEKNIYLRPPRNPKENILNNKVIGDILLKGFFLFAAVSSVYFYSRFQNYSIAVSQTFAFTAWIFGHIILAYVSRSDKEIIFSSGMFKNKIINFWAIAAVAFLILGIYLPVLNGRLNLSPINFMQLIFIALFVIIIVSLLELRKIFKKKY